MQFEKFTQLPPELRRQIWRLTVEPATFHFEFLTSQPKNTWRLKNPWQQTTKCAIKVIRLTPCDARWTCREAKETIGEIRNFRTFQGFYGKMKRAASGRPWEVTRSKPVTLDPDHDMIYLVDSHITVPIDVLAFAYPDLCEITPAMSICTSNPLNAIHRVFRRFLRPKTFTLIVNTKWEDKTKALHKTKQELLPILAKSEQDCKNWLQQPYADKLAKRWQTPVYINVCAKADEITRPNQAKYYSSYSVLCQKTEEQIQAENIPVWASSILSATTLHRALPVEKRDR